MSMSPAQWAEFFQQNADGAFANIHRKADRRDAARHREQLRQEALAHNADVVASADAFELQKAQEKYGLPPDSTWADVNKAEVEANFKAIERRHKLETDKARDLSAMDFYNRLALNEYGREWEIADAEAKLAYLSDLPTHEDLVRDVALQAINHPGLPKGTKISKLNSLEGGDMVYEAMSPEQKSFVDGLINEYRQDLFTQKTNTVRFVRGRPDAKTRPSSYSRTGGAGWDSAIVPVPDSGRYERMSAPQDFSGYFDNVAALAPAPENDPANPFEIDVAALVPPPSPAPPPPAPTGVVKQGFSIPGMVSAARSADNARVRAQVGANRLADEGLGSFLNYAKGFFTGHRDAEPKTYTEMREEAEQEKYKRMRERERVERILRGNDH